MTMRNWEYLVAAALLPVLAAGCRSKKEDDTVNPLRRAITVEGHTVLEDVPPTATSYGTPMIATSDEATVLFGSKDLLFGFGVETGSPVKLFSEDLGSEVRKLFWAGEFQLVAITRNEVFLIDFEDREHPSIVTRFTPPPRMDLPVNEQEPDSLLQGGCLLGDMIVVTPDGSRSAVSASLLTGLGQNTGGVLLYKLDALGTGDLGMLPPDYHLETPWLSASDCVADSASGRIFIADNKDGAYWPLFAEVLVGIGVVEFLQIGLADLGDKLTALAGGDANALAPYVWEGDDTGNFAEQAVSNNHKAYEELRVRNGGNLTNQYTADLIAPRDPPGPFAIDFAAIGFPVGVDTLRGDGPIWVDMNGENVINAGTDDEEIITVPQLVVEFLGNFATALTGSGDAQQAALVRALEILLSDLVPHYCWQANPLEAGANDFYSQDKNCMYFIPRFGLEGVTFAPAAISSGGTALLEDELFTLHAGVLMMANPGANPGDIAANATVIAKYNVQMMREYMWLVNRANAGADGLVHEIDASNLDELGQFFPAPTWGQVSELLDEIGEALTAQLYEDLTHGVPDTDVGALIEHNVGEDLFPVDFGPEHTYPEGDDPSVAIFAEKRGVRAKMWGTEGLKIRSPWLGPLSYRATRVEGSPYWIASSRGDGWQIYDTSTPGEMRNVLHIGQELPSALDIAGGAYPLVVRFAHDFPTLGGFTQANAQTSVALDSRTVALVDQGGTTRDGRLIVCDLTALNDGAEPVQQFNSALGAGTLLSNAAVLPEAGVIWVLGDQKDESTDKAVLWRITADVPFTY